MFAAGKGAASSSIQKEDSRWLSVGKSYKGKSSSVLLVSSSSSSNSNSSDDYDKYRELKRQKKKRKKKRRRQHSEDYKPRKALNSKPDEYVIDRNGDWDSLQFWSLDRKDIPRYSLSSGRKVLLGHNKFSFVHPPSTSKEVVRYFSPKVQKEERNPQTKRLNLATCEKRLTRKQKSNSKSMNFIPLDPIVVSELDMKTEAEAHEASLLQRAQEFHKALDQDPNDIQRWLDFTSFQEESLLYYDSSTKAQRDGILEKQRVILQKAIVKNPNSRVLLQTQLNLRLVQEKDDPELVLSMFENEYIGSPDIYIWKRYISHCLQQFTLFSVPNTKQLFAQAMNQQQQRLRPEQNAKLKSSSTHVFNSKSLLYQKPNVTEEEKLMCANYLSLLSSATNVEDRAGYTEHAVAIYQALFEFNLFLPQPLQCKDLSTKLQVFSKYWEEEGPRAGEFESKSPRSFDKWYCQKFSTDNVDPSLDSTKIFSNSAPPIPCAKDFLEFVESQKFNATRDLRMPLTEWCKGGETFDDSPTTSTRQQKQQDSSSSSKMVYSNVHGYRIAMTEKKDTGEYERILGELRGEEKQDFLPSRNVNDNTSDGDLQLQKESVDISTDSYLKWLVTESELQQTQWLPIRTTDEAAAEESPDRVVFFEDIQPYVFGIEDETCQVDFVFQFLKFLGCSFDDDYSTEFLDSNSDELRILLEPLLSCIPLTPPAGKHLEMGKYGQMADLLQAQQMVCELRITDKRVLVDPSRTSFIRNLLHRSISRFSENTDLQCALASFEAYVATALNQQDAGRSALKTLLQHNAECLRLWSCYVKMEASFGCTDEAMRICEKALTLAPAVINSVAARRGSSIHQLMYLRCRLPSSSSFFEDWRTIYSLAYGVLVIPDNNIQLKPLKKICKEARRQNRSEKEILKEVIVPFLPCARKRFRQELYALAPPVSSQAANNTGTTYAPFVYCLSNFALFQYVTLGLEESLKVYEEWTNKLLVTGEGKEILKYIISAKLELVYRHANEAATVVPFPPRRIRELVLDAVTHVPCNPLLLRCLIESSASSSQTLRNYFDDRIRYCRYRFERPDVTEWIFALVAEVCRGERLVEINASNANSIAVCRIANIMNNAVESCGSALLWRLKIRLEMHRGRVTEAKKTFYRAVHHCPWSKALYTDAIGVLRYYMSPSELNEVFDLAASKEILFRREFT